MSWRNNDGLVVRFGRERVQNTNPRGESPGAGPYRTIEGLVDLRQTVAATPFILDGDVIGSNSEIVKVRYIVTEALTGATAFTFGLQYYDGTEFDYDGFVTAAAPIVVGTEYTLTKGTGTGNGALIGTILARPGQLVLTPTGQATTGKIFVQVDVVVPGKNPVPVVNS